MPWYAWVAAVGIAVANLCAIAAVGKPRPVGTAANAVMTTIINGLLIWAIVELGVRA